MVEGRDARLFGLSLVAFSARGLLIWIEGRLDGLGAAVLVPALTLSWLIAMAVPAAIACDRWSRPVVGRLGPLAVVPFARPVASGFFALAASLATLWMTTSAPEPIRVSVGLGAPDRDGRDHGGCRPRGSATNAVGYS